MITWWGVSTHLAPCCVISFQRGGCFNKRWEMVTRRRKHTSPKSTKRRGKVGVKKAPTVQLLDGVIDLKEEEKKALRGLDSEVVSLKLQLADVVIRKFGLLRAIESKRVEMMEKAQQITQSYGMPPEEKVQLDLTKMQITRPD
jgi:hypothetical protein